MELMLLFRVENPSPDEVRQRPYPEPGEEHPSAAQLDSTTGINYPENNQDQSPGEQSRPITRRTTWIIFKEKNRGRRPDDALEVNPSKPQESKGSLEVAFFDHLRETTPIIKKKNPMMSLRMSLKRMLLTQR
jgi:hypothetical protein